MNADRAEKIINEEVKHTINVLWADPQQIRKAVGDDPIEDPLDAFNLLIDQPPTDVRMDAQHLMEALIETVNRWQRQQNRIIDGRVAIIAMDLLADQQKSIMRRMADENAGPAGPHKS